MKILINVVGWLGDAIIAQSAAKILHEENPNVEVDYLIGFPQTSLLLENNPYINKVIISSTYGYKPDSSIYESSYDIIYTLKPYDGSNPLSIFHQINCGVKNPILSYKVYTIDELDNQVKRELDELNNGKPNIGICLTWKSDKLEIYDPTPLISELNQDYNLFSIGKPPTESQHHSACSPQPHIEYAYNASLCKNLDLVIGSEGGLTNLAAGSGGRVLYTTDFTQYLAGPSGSHYQNPNPINILGPKSYFPDGNHIPLPYDITPPHYIDTIKSYLKKIF